MRFDIKTISEMNAREHWTVKNRRKKAQQHDFTILWKQQKVKVSLPAVIVFTRHSHKTLDTDNLAGAFKNCRDALAKQIGVDDGSPEIEWRYGQVKTPKRENYFEIEIRPL